MDDLDVTPILPSVAATYPSSSNGSVGAVSALGDPSHSNDTYLSKEPELNIPVLYPVGLVVDFHAMHLCIIYIYIYIFLCV